MKTSPPMFSDPKGTRPMVCKGCEKTLSATRKYCERHCDKRKKEAGHEDKSH